MLFCGSSNVVHNGLRGHIQRYKCKACGRRFDGGIRRDKSQVITDYIEGKQTYAQLATKYGVTGRTIARDLEGMRYVQKISKHKQVVIQMDTTYWGRNFGLMVIKDALRKKIIWRKYVTHETVASYMEGIQWLRGQGFKIYGVVIDGLRGLAQALRPYPVQLCQFHQALTVRHYLTQEPEPDASRELLDLVNNITRMGVRRMVRKEQGHRQRARPRQTDQEENAALHAAQITQRIPQRQTEHAPALDFL